MVATMTIILITRYDDSDDNNNNNKILIVLIVTLAKYNGRGSWNWLLYYWNMIKMVKL